jgi:hypothetical protein
MQLWEDLSSFRGELKKAARAKVCLLYSLLPNREPGDGRTNDARYIDELKAAVQNILEDSKFLHNGKDRNVRTSFHTCCVISTSILMSVYSIRVARTISLTQLLQIYVYPSIMVPMGLWDTCFQMYSVKRSRHQQWCW